MQTIGQTATCSPKGLWGKLPFLENPVESQASASNSSEPGIKETRPLTEAGYL